MAGTKALRGGTARGRQAARTKIAAEEAEEAEAPPQKAAKTAAAKTAAAKPAKSVKSVKSAFPEKAPVKPAGVKANLATMKARKSAAPQPNALVLRVYKTIDGELTKLEKQIGTKSQDRERASRALSQVVNSLEKAVEMQREIAKDKKCGGGTKDKDALRHAENLRKEIADRIERLRATRTAAE